MTDMPLIKKKFKVLLDAKERGDLSLKVILFSLLLNSYKTA